ncbi:MAG: nucleotidyltransferase domain-containing protein [Hyphomicrobiales bacterium]|nr:nucleotidyltransferase domain-containing protein [Hyphomicrobiales bacterium]
MATTGMNSSRIDPESEEAIHRFLRRVADRYDLAGAILYGSRARGTHRPDSDADVAVLLKGEHQKILKVALAMSDMAYDVLLETGINISPLPVWLDEWERPERYSNPTLLRNIAREGARL